MAAVYKLKLEQPGLFELESNDGLFKKVFDLFQAYQKIADADATPSQDAKWLAIRSYMATGLGCAVDQITVSQAYDFREHVIAAGKQTIETVKKKLETIASLQQPTLESQATTPVGQSG